LKGYKTIYANPAVFYTALTLMKKNQARRAEMTKNYRGKRWKKNSKAGDRAGITEEIVDILSL